MKAFMTVVRAICKRNLCTQVNDSDAPPSYRSASPFGLHVRLYGINFDLTQWGREIRAEREQVVRVDIASSWVLQVPEHLER